MIHCKVWTHKLFNSWFSSRAAQITEPFPAPGGASFDDGAIILGKKLKVERAAVLSWCTGSYKRGALSGLSCTIHSFYQLYNERLSREFVKIVQVLTE